MPSPICLVNGLSTTNGFNTGINAYLTISLADYSGVNSWEFKCIGTDEGQSAAAINSSFVFDKTLQTYKFYTPRSKSSLIFQSKINNGYDKNGNYQNSYTTTFEVFVPASNGYRLVALNESEQGGESGWATDINEILETGISPSSDINSSYITTTGSLTVSEFETTGATGVNSILGGVILQTRIMAGPLTFAYLDNAQWDRLVFCETSTGTIIYLPQPTAGRTITIINATTSAEGIQVRTYYGENIYFTTPGYYDTALNIPSQQSITLICNGTDWHYTHNSTGIEF
jgi:hypothetical protein